MAQQPVNVQPQFQIAYVDLPEVSETFADSVEKIGIESGVWRFDFCVTRMGEPKPNGIIPGKKHPACRLVMTMNGGLELFNKLKGLIEIMEKQGMLKTTSVANVMPPVSGQKPN